MLSYMLPVEEKVNFAEGDASSFTPLSDDRSPVSETKPLLGEEKSEKLASLTESVQLDSPSAEAKLIMDAKEKEKTHDPEENGLETKAVGSSEERSPAASEDKSVFSETLASPGSDDRSIIKTSASTKPNLKRTETATQQKPASKVRVTFYESSKPLVVTSPEPSEFDQYSPQDFIMASPLSDGTHLPPAFDRQLSTESGRDNPFRPDGDISREADEIVQLIKSGRPLQGQQGRGDATDSIDSGPISPDGKEASSEPLISANDASPQQQQIPSPLPVPTQTVGATTTGSPGKAGANGSAAPDNSTPGTVEVTHATVKPTDAAHVEHVVIKKKSKCNCCVIQ
ncbi:uncharacterized protein [Macrobrachium rosenbergii]|uniref:uncharacterized protein isoform X8 n=1 Tax=Macrobrachium rosenbergii TaxID=79674 RepID=UPI0034D45C86